MKPELQQELDALLKAYDQKQHAQEIKDQDIKAEEEKFLESFYSVRDSIIAPALEELGEIVKARGHGFEIEKRDYSIDSKGRTDNAMIAIVFIPGGSRSGYYAERYRYPSLGFTCDRHKEVVALHGSTLRPLGGGSLGPRGECKLEQITTDFIHAQAFEILKEVFK